LLRGGAVSQGAPLCLGALLGMYRTCGLVGPSSQWGVEARAQLPRCERLCWLCRTEGVAFHANGSQMGRVEDVQL
jgi:hypothetical protein